MLGKLHTYGCPQWLDEKVLKLDLFTLPQQVAVVVPSEIEDLAAQRREAKQNKDFAQADSLRKQIETA